MLLYIYNALALHYVDIRQEKRLRRAFYLICLNINGFGFNFAKDVVIPDCVVGSTSAELNAAFKSIVIASQANSIAALYSFTSRLLA